MYSGWTFFTFFCCKSWNDDCLKRPKLNDKRGRIWPFLKKQDRPIRGNFDCIAGLKFYTFEFSSFRLHSNNNKFSCLVKSNLVELETNCIVILPPWWVFSVHTARFSLTQIWRFFKYLLGDKCSWKEAKMYCGSLGYLNTL